MLSKQLLDEMGLLNLKHKQYQPPIIEQSTITVPENKTTVVETEPVKTPEIVIEKQTTTEPPKLDKNEFRLLVKMLQAIGHECIYDNIIYDGTSVTYKLPNRSLIFNDINLPDNASITNLCSLSNLLLKPELKRPVWEKLKTI